MSAEYTPGPWKVVDGHYPSFKGVTGPSFTISVVMWATDLTEADYQKRNADLHLIAAAPDLLEAAELALQSAESWIYDQLDGTSSLESALAKLDPVRAAIAKATGGQE
jgi:hypothetical protein